MDMQEVLANIPQEGELPEAPETVTPTATPADENQPGTVVEKPAEEGDNTPTEEDNDYKERTSKRVQQLLKERSEERSQREALEARLAKLEQKESPSEEIPERWSNLYSTGDPAQDKIAYQEWKSFNEEEKAAWKAEALAELKAAETKEAEEQEQMAQAYESQLDELEADGKEFDRNALMKFMTDIPGGLWTTDGKPNFALGLELMEARKAPSVKAQVKKSLGSLHTPGGTGQKEYFGPEDFSGFKAN